MPKSPKKSQAASEYLVTYAWAILIIVAVLGIIYYFGMWDFLAPRDCTLTAGLNCYDFKVQSNAVYITLLNNFGEIITINDIDVQDCKGNPESKILQDNEKAIFTIASCNITGKKYTGQLNITYTAESNLQHHLEGQIRDIVEQT